MNDFQQGLFWLIAHIVLAVLAPMFPIVVAAWLACVIGAAILFAIRDRNKAGTLHLAGCYLCGFEVLARMTKAPLPWETGKYLGIPLIVFGLTLGKRLGTLVPGLLLLACITPSLLRTDFSRDIRDTLVFNWFGVLILTLSVMYFYRRVLMENDLVWILRAIAGPILSVAIVSNIISMDLAKVTFSLSANWDTTGFGVNQIATAFGMGLVALAVAFFINRPLFGLAGIDFVIALYLFFRALLSFSRGGLISAMIAAAGALAVILWAYFRQQNLGQVTRVRKLLLIPLILITLGTIFLITDQISGGMLSLRYRGETEGTLAGDREMTLAVLTTGRSEIVRTDFEMWYDHLVLGVGPGNSARMRPVYGYSALAPHTEYSRLMAEHGILGLIFCAVIVLMPLVIACNPRYPVMSRATMAAFTLFSLSVMAHSATRLFGTTYLYGIGCALIVPRDVLMRLAVNHPVIRRRLSFLLGRLPPA